MNIEEEKKKKKTMKDIFISIPLIVKEIIVQILFMFRFFILLSFVSIRYLLIRTPKKKLNKPKEVKVSSSFKKAYDGIYNKVLDIFDTREESEIKNSDLIFLAMRNLSMKKNRTYVTIGGMAIGFGAVILLLSLGYGFEKLVVSQVASLSEMRQVDVTVSKGSPLVFNSEVISNISGIDEIKRVIPIITSVSKITYNNAVSDAIVYGVPSEYFEETGISPILGEIFSDDTNNIHSENILEKVGEVAGVSTVLIGKKDIGEEVYKLNYSINPTIWKAVYSKPDSKSKIIGYTKREPGKQSGIEVWGERYFGENIKQAVDIEGTEYSVWVKGDFPIWEMKVCSPDKVNCVDNQYVLSKSPQGQIIEQGYITEEDVLVDRYELIKGSPLEVYSGKKIEDIHYQIDVSKHISLYLDSTNDSVILPILNNDLSRYYDGTLIYGERYGDGNFGIKSSNAKEYGYWIKTNIELWSDPSCENTCNEYTTYKKEEDDKVVETVGYLKLSEVIISQNISIY